MEKCKVFMLSLYRQTDRRTTVKQYATHLSMQGYEYEIGFHHYKMKISGYSNNFYL